MAGDWIKMRADLHTHPKVVRISSALDADRLRVSPLGIRRWWSAASFSVLPLTASWRSSCWTDWVMPSITVN